MSSSNADWKTPHRKALRNSIQFFSNNGKFDREVWVVRQLLVATQTVFEPPDFRPDEEPVDVSFHDARFQVKELMQNGRRRLDEIREDLEKLESAETYEDLLETYTPKDVTFAQIVEDSLDLARSLETSKYGPAEVRSMDLLCYFNWLDYSVTPPLTIPECNTNFRSISVVSNTCCSVIKAQPSAPHFLQNNVGRVFSNDAR